MKASMQKLIAMGLCVVLAVGSLTGCGGSSNDAGSASGDGAKTSSSSDQKTFSDLGGMDITVGDWFTSKDTLANRTDEFGKKQNEYWKSISLTISVISAGFSSMIVGWFCSGIAPNLLLPPSTSSNCSSNPIQLF